MSESVFCMSISSVYLSVCSYTARWLTLFLVECCAPSSSERCSGDGFEITVLKSEAVKLVVVVATAAAVSVTSKGMVV